MGRLSGKVCIVTGGASGIGASTARVFSNEGAAVVISDIQDELGQKLATEIGAHYIHHDVSDEAAWHSISDKVQAEHGRLDVLVNNAGMFGSDDIETVTLESWNRVLTVNLTSVMLGCQTAIKLMKKNPDGPSGSIVNVSSIAGYVGLAGALAYTASKGGVRLLTKSVAVHCARTYQNIRCNSVHPGAIDTPMNQAAFDETGDPDGMRSMFGTLQPIGRMTTSEEVAKGILYLASDDASSTTGTELLIDGGWLAAPNPL